MPPLACSHGRNQCAPIQSGENIILQFAARVKQKNRHGKQLTLMMWLEFQFLQPSQIVQLTSQRNYVKNCLDRSCQDKMQDKSSFGEIIRKLRQGREEPLRVVAAAVGIDSTLL